MATTDFNLRPPVNSPISGSDGKLTADWSAFFQQLFQFFQTSFTPNFVLIPSSTTDEINNYTVQNGTIVYNTTIEKYQCYENGVWVTFTTS